MNPIDPGFTRNIIFDLGGVLLNIDYHKTEQAFIDLGIADFNSLYSQFHANSFFEDFEKGKIDPVSFVKEIRSYAPGSSEQDIILAWNAMLLDFPSGRFEFLISLKSRYRTFLLSNTNAIHHQAFQKIALGEARKLEDCFEKAYFSHEIGMRKPDREIFEFVVKENSLISEETLFIDDTVMHVDAARSLNLRVFYHEPGARIEILLANF